jgi:hypothetical protein
MDGRVDGRDVVDVPRDAERQHAGPLGRLRRLVMEVEARLGHGRDGGGKAPSRDGGPSRGRCGGGGALRRREIGREMERQLKVDIVEARAEREQDRHVVRANEGVVLVPRAELLGRHVVGECL